MGCGLRKLEDPEDSSPGKIYSSLRRPLVETRTESAYDYVLLDFSLEGDGTAALFSDFVHVISTNDLEDQWNKECYDVACAFFLKQSCRFVSAVCNIEDFSS